MIRQFPHCDARILHAPGECEFCDLHPEWQELRKTWMVAFTGHKPKTVDHVGSQVPCPADFNRPAGSTSDHRRWYGNGALTTRGLAFEVELEEVELEVSLPPLRPAPTRPDPGLTEKKGGTPPSGSGGQSFWARVFPWLWR